MRQHLDFENAQETATPRVKLFPYFETALLSGTASILFGSMICGLYLLASSGEFGELGLIVILMIYSAVVILPVSLLLAFPLIVLLRKISGISQIAISTVAGLLLSGILFSKGSWLFDSDLPISVVGAVYGFIFGLTTAWLFPRWCAPRTGKAVTSHRSP